MSAPQSRLPPPVILQQSACPTPAPDLPESDTEIRPASQKRPVRPPKLLLKVSDLCCTGSLELLSAINAGTALSDAVTCVLDCLYSDDSTLIPPTRSVTLVLRSMSGVAYTTGKDIDQDHKEIHLSTDYIKQISAHRKREEITGVLTHEMVHCWQWSANGTAPGGLIEGIADWVRLRAGYAPPHWERKADGEWDSGYQHTAYFLDYLEFRFGKSTVPRMNAALRDRKYREGKFWTRLFRRPVAELWGDYKSWLEQERKDIEPAAVTAAEPPITRTVSVEPSPLQEALDGRPENRDEDEPVLVEREDADVASV
ncbi:MAG: hypothetical protein M1825_000894 [Sarcosagium campestre]|nr:MAG: hypothetical protein M1825_000894 [Sarcosagium campestre]